jgi:hypothetical protein
MLASARFINVIISFVSIKKISWSTSVISIRNHINPFPLEPVIVIKIISSIVDVVIEGEGVNTCGTGTTMEPGECGVDTSIQVKRHVVSNFSATVMASMVMQGDVLIRASQILYIT